MKNLFSKILLLPLFCLLAGQVALCAQDLRFNGPCDFGTIHEKDGVAERTFSFRNDRRDTVVICGITTACRCITGDPSFAKVPPGGKGEITLRFDPAYRSGAFGYTVVLWYMDRKIRQSVKVSGNVVPMRHPIEEDHPYGLGEGLYTSHKVLPFGTLAPGQTKKMFFRYGNGTDAQMDLKFEIEGCCAHMIGMETHLVLAPDERGKLYVSLTMPEGYKGKHINRIWPVVNGIRLDEPILVKMTSKNQ